MHKNVNSSSLFGQPSITVGWRAAVLEEKDLGVYTNVEVAGSTEMVYCDESLLLFRSESTFDGFFEGDEEDEEEERRDFEDEWLLEKAAVKGLE